MDLIKISIHHYNLLPHTDTHTHTTGRGRLHRFSLHKFAGVISRLSKTKYLYRVTHLRNEAFTYLRCNIFSHLWHLSFAIMNRQQNSFCQYHVNIVYDPTASFFQNFTSKFSLAIRFWLQFLQVLSMLLGFWHYPK